VNHRKEVDMTSPPQNKDKGEKGAANSGFHILPNVNLIEQKQWHYIRRRYHLSPRELEVAKLVCKGLTNKEIASELKVRQGTVNTHLKNIFRKARARSKLTLFLRFIQDANECPSEPAPTSPIRIIDIEKPAKKIDVPTETPKKDE
jgi:DNA-binding CsgD family transcriptional regulator